MIKFVSIHSMKITHPDLKTAVETVMAWRERQLKTPKMALVIVGPNGTGKTHIARSLLWANCYMFGGKPVGYDGFFIKADELMRRLSESEVEQVIPSAPPIVVIDDVGHERVLQHIGADFQRFEIQDRYTAIVDYCYDKNIGLIITGSNNCGSFKQLEEHIGPRAWDRLCEMAPRNGKNSFMLNLARVPSYRQIRSGRQVQA